MKIIPTIYVHMHMQAFISNTPAFILCAMIVTLP